MYFLMMLNTTLLLAIRSLIVSLHLIANIGFFGAFLVFDLGVMLAVKIARDDLNYW